jgi:hypothetical protein
VDRGFRLREEHDDLHGMHDGPCSAAARGVLLGTELASAMAGA